MACWGFRCLGQAKRRGTPASCREGFGGGARGSLTLPSEAHRKSFLSQAAACRNGGRPASCREGFGGGARGSLTLPSEAHRKSFLGQAAACRNVCGRGPWAKRRGRPIEQAFWAKLRPAGTFAGGAGGRREGEASDRPQRGRGRPAGCRGGFEGGARGSLTLPSEAHRKSFLGQAAA